MNYGNIKSYDIADGTGVRVSLFMYLAADTTVRAVLTHLRGDFNYGKPFTRRLRIRSWSCLLRLI